VFAAVCSVNVIHLPCVDTVGVVGLFWNTFDSIFIVVCLGHGGRLWTSQFACTKLFRRIIRRPESFTSANRSATARPTRRSAHHRRQAVRHDPHGTLAATAVARSADRVLLILTSHRLVAHVPPTSTTPSAHANASRHGATYAARRGCSSSMVARMIGSSQQARLARRDLHVDGTTGYSCSAGTAGNDNTAATADGGGGGVDGG
jgi:hypothetical protein